MTSGETMDFLAKATSSHVSQPGRFFLQQDTHHHKQTQPSSHPDATFRKSHLGRHRRECDFLTSWSCWERPCGAVWSGRGLGSEAFMRRTLMTISSARCLRWYLACNKTLSGPSNNNRDHVLSTLTCAGSKASYTGDPVWSPPWVYEVSVIIIFVLQINELKL